MDIRSKCLASAAMLALAAPAAAETLNYSYDPHGRLTRVQRAGGPGAGVATAHSYDSGDNRVRRDIASGAAPAPSNRPPGFTISNAEVREGGQLVFTVTRHGSMNEGYTLLYATSTASAAAGDDFVSESSSIDFTVNDFALPITIDTVEDSAVEADETLTVTLSDTSGRGAILSDATGAGTITNDDQTQLPAPTAVNDYTSVNHCGDGVIVNVIENDSDAGGNTPLTLDAILSETGSAGIASSTHIRVQPESPGDKQVVYRVRNSAGGTATATLYVDVIGSGPCE